jgi:Rrf2 family protein
VLELALHFDSGQPVQLRKIAQTHSIPPTFLVQIFQQLKAAGFVASVRGSTGGYRLTVPPSEITLGEVFALFAGTNAPFPTTASASPVAWVLRDKWEELARMEAAILDATTFADLAQQVQDATSPMYYI